MCYAVINMTCGSKEPLDSSDRMFSYCHVLVTVIISCGYYYSLSLSLSTTSTTTVSTLEWIEFSQISYMKSFDD